jgi:sigma-B regulation protein RsbU (phosphoserine phosphatase)
LRFCHRYSPSGAVGGDFFNVLSFSDTEAGVFICDVMGHGVRSALITAMVRALVEELTPRASDPGQLLTLLNRDLQAILRQTGTPMFTTAFYLVVDLSTRQMRYANAGHPKQLLVHRREGEVEFLRSLEGKTYPPLGLFPESIYPTSQRAFLPGDLVILYTDGLYEVEGANQQVYSQEMLLAAVRRRTHLPTPALFDDLLNEIQAFSGSGEHSDDVCLVGMDIAETG